MIIMPKPFNIHKKLKNWHLFAKWCRDGERNGQEEDDKEEDNKEEDNEEEGNKEEVFKEEEKVDLQILWSAIADMRCGTFFSEGGAKQGSAIELSSMQQANVFSTTT